MERKINNLIEEEFTEYKCVIKTNIVNMIQMINNKSDPLSPELISTELMSLLQQLYDRPILKLTHEDFEKRKRAKNVVELQVRCTALRANGEQCTRRKKNDSNYCGTHNKGTPHGLAVNNDDSINNTLCPHNVSVWAHDFNGIVYYIDVNMNVYDTAAVVNGVDNPSVIAKYTKTIDNEGNDVYCIPNFII
jgi:hypothetical protein